MMVIVGLVVLLIGVIVGTVGVLGNAGATHPLAENFSVLGYHVTGSTGTLFLSGIVVGAVGLLGLSVLLAGARRSAVCRSHGTSSLPVPLRQPFYRFSRPLLERKA